MPKYPKIDEGSPNFVVGIMAALFVGVLAYMVVPQFTTPDKDGDDSAQFDAYQGTTADPAPAREQKTRATPEPESKRPAIPDELPEDSEIAKEMKNSSRIEYIEGKGWARVTDPGPDAERPPAPDELPEDRVINDEIPEEKPQTPEWKIEKTNKIFDHMAGRLDRLEDQIAEAERAGDHQRARHKRLLMKRTEHRLVELEGELEELRQQAAESNTSSEDTTPPPNQGASSTSGATSAPTQQDQPGPEEQ